jgi:capsular exopolysaccharide synthesis family protein
MSLIFDALQRSEAERSGVDLIALSAATEVLQLAELHAVSERKAAIQFEQPGATQSAERDWSLPPQAVPPAATAVEAPGPVELSRNEERLDVFGQFQSLQVLVSAGNRLVCLTDNESLAAEKFRFLGISLQHLRRDRPLKKVLITSTIPQEGKSTVAANLACTLARRKPHKTLLLEGDLRRPTVAQKFGLGNVPGLSEWLRGETEAKNIYRLEALGLWVLPAGSAPENPLELMQSGKLSLLMEELSASFDWIVIDSPPVLPLADTSIWARMADGILLVTRKGVTEKKQLQRGMEALERSKLLGALVNGSTDAAHSDYYQRYGPAVSSPNSPRTNK